MGYYGGYRRRSYKSWRSRGYGRTTSWTSKYAELNRIFGPVVPKIRAAFLELADDALDELLSDYGAIHGASAEQYARKTHPAWKSGKTNLSGQTMERLVELVPPYLEPEQRMALVRELAKKHEPRKPFKSVAINIEQPDAGFAQLDSTLDDMDHEDVLAHLPEQVMKAATWLYDDDITAARAVLAEAKRVENQLTKAQARREIELLKRTILSGQVKTANYSVELPAGTLSVSASRPPKGLFATLFGWLG